MELAMRHHTGTRKDGQREISHQLEIASYLVFLSISHLLGKQAFFIREIHALQG